jgi:hypothetical protein
MCRRTGFPFPERSVSGANPGPTRGRSQTVNVRCLPNWGGSCSAKKGLSPSLTARLRSTSIVRLTGKLAKILTMSRFFLAGKGSRAGNVYQFPTGRVVRNVARHSRWPRSSIPGHPVGRCRRPRCCRRPLGSRPISTRAAWCGAAGEDFARGGKDTVIGRAFAAQRSRRRPGEFFAFDPCITGRTRSVCYYSCEVDSRSLVNVGHPEMEGKVMQDPPAGSR